MEIVIGFLILIALLVFYVISIYNSLVAKRNQVANIEAGVDTQLKRRYDLLPNLVAAANQYLIHERELLEKITELRSRAKNATTQKEKFDLNAKISNLLPSVKLMFEAYPELKANENVLYLQESLNDVEEQISAARRAYNSAVEIYNNAVEMFPSNLIANSMSFQKAKFFDIPQIESKNHNVSELFKHS
ncbi:LemA family protein [Campylobacter sp. RM16192]|uniref:LemA family protein n=1 Tax=Campylobacter sp. RM16192 TaxID=1660080 RepID=UPI0014520DD3|nr:LemA family protein [Campylobacter sp. RM16192]QCD53487.1 LemA protein [Campylobacter sp. RM16192]